MRRLAVILSGVLALQVAGAVALALNGPDYAAFRPSEPLLAFDPAKVTEVAIDQSKGYSVTLRRKDDSWVLPGLYDFPVEGDKVAKLLKDLGGLRKGLPVASAGTAAKRFKVTADDHERRIVLSGSDGKLGEIFIGTSPSYRWAHARGPEDKAVYSVEFASYDAGTRPADWQQRDFLHMAKDDIQRVELPSLVLSRKDDGFVVEGLEDGQETDQEAAGKLVDKIAGLSFASVEGRGEEALARIGEPDLTLRIGRKAGGTLSLQFTKMAEKDDYLLASSASDYLFSVSNYTVKPLLEIDRDKLVEEKPVGPNDGAVSQKPGAGEGGSG